MATAPKPKPNKDLPTKRGMKAIQKKLTKPKAAAKPNAVEKLAQNITNRYRVTAREARDIVTAIGTQLQTDVGNRERARTGRTESTGPSGKNLIRQVGETVRAAATGKTGTTSDKIKVKGPLTAQQTLGYEKGKKRK